MDKALKARIARIKQSNQIHGLVYAEAFLRIDKILAEIKNNGKTEPANTLKMIKRHCQKALEYRKEQLRKLSKTAETRPQDLPEMVIDDYKDTGRPEERTAKGSSMKALEEFQERGN